MGLLTEIQDGDYLITTFKHYKSVKESLKNITPEEFDLVLQIAAEALKDLRNSVNSLQYKEMLENELKKHTSIFVSEKLKIQEETNLLVNTHKYEVEALNATNKRKLSELEAKLRKLESELSVSDFTISKMKEQFDSVKENSEAVLKLSVDEIVKQKQTQYDKELERIQRAHKLTCEGLENQARERVHQCDLQHKEAIEKMRELYQEQERKIRKELEKTFVSSERGKQGEQEFEDLARQYVNWPPMVNMSKNSHGTDRRCKIRSCNTLFEIKNYTDDVPSKEVVKFERDMEENQDCPMGVFISMNTNIVGKKSGKFITTAWTPKSQLLVYVNSFYTHSPDDVLSFIDICADLAWTIFKSANDAPDESDSAIQLEGRINQAKVFVEKEIKRMADLLRTISHNKTFIMDTITKQSAEYTYNIQQSKQALQGMLEILLGKTDEANDDSSNTSSTNQTDIPLAQNEPVAPEKKTKAKAAPKKKGVVWLLKAEINPAILEWR